VVFFRTCPEISRENPPAMLSCAIVYAVCSVNFLPDVPTGDASRGRADSTARVVKRVSRLREPVRVIAGAELPRRRGFTATPTRAWLMFRQPT